MMKVINEYKVVTNNINKLNKARVLAYWIKDDGGIDSFKPSHLYTNKFSFNNINLLQEALKENINLRNRIYKKIKNTDQEVIVIPVIQIQTLALIVAPYMLPTSTYKVKGLNQFLNTLTKKK